MTRSPGRWYKVEALRGFFVGMIVGGVLGGVATFAALTKPWQIGQEISSAAWDAAPAPTSSGKKKRRKRNRSRKPSVGTEDMVVSLSAADRELVWKGPNIKLPPKNVDFAGDSGRSLEQGEIDQGVAGGGQAIVGCIGNARGNAELEATITLKLLVGPDGRVLKRRVRAPRYLQAHGLFSCVTSASNRMRFAAVGGHTVVTVPFNLE